MPGAAKKPTGPFIKEVAATLREKIARENLSHQQIADAVGISRPQVSKIIAGDKAIDMELLDELCWALGLKFRDVVVDADTKTAFRHVDPEWTTPAIVRH